MITLYHGTTLENAELIIAGGFRENTYFARAREDAIAFGGPFVFTVQLTELREPPDMEEADRWQVITRNIIPESCIVAVEEHSTR